MKTEKKIIWAPTNNERNKNMMKWASVNTRDYELNLNQMCKARIGYFFFVRFCFFDVAANIILWWTKCITYKQTNISIYISGTPEKKAQPNRKIIGNNQRQWKLQKAREKKNKIKLHIKPKNKSKKNLWCGVFSISCFKMLCATDFDRRSRFSNNFLTRTWWTQKRIELNWIEREKNHQTTNIVLHCKL